jgi:hypothetical protein
MIGSSAPIIIEMRYSGGVVIPLELSRIDALLATLPEPIEYEIVLLGDQ